MDQILETRTNHLRGGWWSDRLGNGSLCPFRSFRLLSIPPEMILKSFQVIKTYTNYASKPARMIPGHSSPRNERVLILLLAVQERMAARQSTPLPPCEKPRTDHRWLPFLFSFLLSRLFLSGA